MTTTARWRQAAIDCVDLYGGTVAEYLDAVPGIERKTLRVNRPGRKVELDDFDGVLQDLDEQLSKAMRLVKNATPSQLKQIVTLKTRNMLHSIREQFDALRAEAPSCLKDTEGFGKQMIKYRAKEAGIYLIDFARKAAWDLGIDLPPVFDLHVCAAGEDADIVKGDVMGFCRKSPVEVFVRSDFGHRDTIETLGHEMFHVWELANGRAPNEAKADDYGRRFACMVIDGLRV